MQCNGSVGRERRCRVSDGIAVMWSPSVWTTWPIARARARIGVPSARYGCVRLDIKGLPLVPAQQASLDRDAPLILDFHAEPSFQARDSADPANIVGAVPLHWKHRKACPSHPMPTHSEPFSLKGLTLRNRIVASPMCQYHARDGFLNGRLPERTASASLRHARSRRRRVGDRRKPPPLRRTVASLLLTPDCGARRMSRASRTSCGRSRPQVPCRAPSQSHSSRTKGIRGLRSPTGLSDSGTRTCRQRG